KDILYIGDSVVDAETARRARLPFVAVLTGVTAKHAFDGHASIAIVDSLARVPELLNNHNSSRE
ncbi:MAG: HAD family hydrolase, partial [Terriglobales bacterium]